MKLTEKDKEKIIQCIKEEKPVPSIYKQKLFKNDGVEYIESTKDYKLVYKGKARKEDIIANTPAAPLQKIRSFNSDNSFDDNWSNMLIFGDNLLALKALYNDQQGPNKYKTKNKIKLIYIDPPFATKQDFMKDREKAYRDKIVGAEFIEFLRKRLILLREILADDGSIYVHLDWKKGHYIKTIMDEIFGEHNFLNHIAWCYKEREISKKQYNQKHDYILFYTKNKNSEYTFNWQDITLNYSEGTIEKYNLTDGDGRIFQLRGKGGNLTGKQGLPLSDEEKHPEWVYRDYLDKKPGILQRDWWADISFVNRAGYERRVTNSYPTQKSEHLLERIIKASSNPNDIVLDAFSGSGTTPAVSEKMNRRWIAIDCGKLSIYTNQKRLLNLTTRLGSETKDNSIETERITDLDKHSKSYSRGFLRISEKARKGELIISDKFLESFAKFLNKNLKGKSEQKFSIACPKSKFKVTNLNTISDEENEQYKAGDKIVKIGRIIFLVSFIQPRKKLKKRKSLNSKKFTLFNAGIYDNNRILQMDWEQYYPFVAQLFGVRLDPHKIYSFEADGYIGVHSTYIWDYPNQKNLILDEEYVHTLHQALGGKAGDKFYIVAPICSLGFMQDEIKIDDTTYVFLKVPLSIIMELINKGEPGALKQPTGEADVNEVMDAVGFDFISQPVVDANYKRATSENKDLFNADDNDYIIEITEFKSDTLAYDPEEFENFETLSMVMVDTDYNGEYFNLSNVYWADTIVDEEKDNAIIRIKEDEFVGETLMVIFMDKYGNELKITRTKIDFR